MTTAVTLTTSWRKVADAVPAHISFQGDDGEPYGDDIHYAFSAGTPAGDSAYHVIDGDCRIGGVLGQDLWVKVSEGTAIAVVDEFPDPVPLGSGLSIISVSANVVVL
jgi:hypothetical protein